MHVDQARLGGIVAMAEHAHPHIARRAGDPVFGIGLYSPRRGQTHVPGNDFKQGAAISRLGPGGKLFPFFVPDSQKRFQLWVQHGSSSQLHASSGILAQRTNQRAEGG